MVGFKLGNYVRLQGLPDAAYNGKLARIKSVGAHEITGVFIIVLQGGEEVPSSSLDREILVKQEHMLRACDGCRLAGATTMQYCGNCKNAAYCNAECQRSDWKRHKVECNEMSTQRQIVKSPLLLAAHRGNLSEVQRLVRDGADVNKCSREDGFFSIYMASEQGHLSVVRYLVQEGADKDKATKNGGTSLFAAAGQGRLSVVQYLVQQGADKNKASNSGTTPLLVAALQGHLEVVQYLVEQGADKNKAANYGATPLWVAAGDGHLAVVQYLVQQGANVNQSANNGTSPLEFAIDRGQAAVADYLREHGAI